MSKLVDATVVTGTEVAPNVRGRWGLGLDTLDVGGGGREPPGGILGSDADGGILLFFDENIRTDIWIGVLR